MIIKKEDKKGISSYLKKEVSSRARAITAVLLILAFCTGTLFGLFVTGYFGSLDNTAPKAAKILNIKYIETDSSAGGVFMAVASTIYRAPLNFIKGYLFSNPERIYLDINFMDYQQLVYKREKSLAYGMLITEGDTDFVPATIRHNDESIKASIRLKGDLIDHLQGDKWSFRIKLNGENTLFGMRAFSISRPEMRGYLYEWVFHEALKREGLIYLRYDFIDVTINGDHKGIYAYEEHFEKRLIENNERREGIIVSFDEDLNMKMYAFGEDVSFEIPSVKLYKPQQTLADPELYSQFMTAKDLLESFRSSKLNTCDVFDCRLLAKYFAVLEVIGAQHAAPYGNLKFYYNPITSLLEPIGFDAELSLLNAEPKLTESWQRFYPNSASMIRKMFSDQRLFSLYVRELEKVSARSYLDNFFAEIDKELQNKINIIHRSYPSYTYSNKMFYDNQKRIRGVLELSPAIYSYFSDYSKDRIVLEIGNTQQLPVEILSASYKNTTLWLKQEDNLLYPSKPNATIEYELFGFTAPENFNISHLPEINVSYRFIGSARVKNEAVIPYPRLSRDFLENDFIRQKPNFEAFDFLAVKGDSIFIKGGYWSLTENLIIPAGYTVFAGPGTTLDLKKGSKVLSYSKLSFIGTENSPIHIISSDGAGEGLIVLSAGGDSILDYAVFDGLSEPTERNWHLTGAVTFYESNVKIYNTKFLNSNSEDGLNIVRSDFEMRNTHFNNTYSDCFDSDFSDGVIADSNFIKCGNDAMDFSGASITIDNALVFNIGDKGVSSGEKSLVKAEDVVIDGSFIGLASKDKSELVVKNSRISNSRYGLAAYKKKTEYGPALLNASSLNMAENVAVPYLIELNSNLILDGKNMPGDKGDVYKELYGEG